MPSFYRKKWELAQVVAKRLVKCDPGNVGWTISLSNATRRVESVEAAKLILLGAVRANVGEARFHYLLACYECQLGDLAAAMKHLRTAIKLNPRFRISALDDEQLMPLWMILGDE